MANIHYQLLEFEKIVSITDAKKKKLILSRRALETRIKNHFKLNNKFLIPKFYIQGSYKMKTMVMKKDGSYDVDLGIYFLKKPLITSVALQKNVLKAVANHTKSGAEHREKCIRVKYKADFDIDLPVYYMQKSDNHPHLATKKEWLVSDPKELCDWFEKIRIQKDKNGQILRLVKYFKAWSYQRNRKMPSGIVFTIWVAKYYKSNLRDDRAFFETAKAIEASFGGGLVNTEVINPAAPKDNLLKLDFDQRTRFKTIFRKMIEDVDQALKTNNNQTAINIWKHQFGDKFPVK